LIAVRQLGLAPSEFWIMRPRHFWWLYEAVQDEREAAGPGLSDDDKAEILNTMIEAGFQ
jgi:hypothetical protein